MLRYTYRELLLLWSNIPIVGQVEILLSVLETLEIQEAAAFNATFSLHQTATPTICW